MVGNIKSQFFATELYTWSIPLISYHIIIPLLGKNIIALVLCPLWINCVMKKPCFVLKEAWAELFSWQLFCACFISRDNRQRFGIIYVQSLSETGIAFSTPASAWQESFLCWCLMGCSLQKSDWSPGADMIKPLQLWATPSPQWRKKSMHFLWEHCLFLWLCSSWQKYPGVKKK